MKKKPIDILSEVLYAETKKIYKFTRGLFMLYVYIKKEKKARKQN